MRTRFKASRAPYRRGGQLFASTRDWLEFEGWPGQADGLTLDQLVALSRDPVIAIEIERPAGVEGEEPRWMEVPWSDREQFVEIATADPAILKPADHAPAEPIAQESTAVAEPPTYDWGAVFGEQYAAALATFAASAATTSDDEGAPPASGSGGQNPPPTNPPAPKPTRAPRRTAGGGGKGGSGKPKGEPVSTA